MILGHGIDIIECERVARLLESHPQLAKDRLFTPTEQTRAEGMKKPIPHLAGRFAAKEAILKVLGTGWRGGIAWTDMEITNDEWGRPHVTLTGACQSRAEELGIAEIALSISHTDNYAVASAIGLPASA